MHLRSLVAWFGSLFSRRSEGPLPASEIELAAVSVTKPVLLVTLLELDTKIVDDVIKRVQRKYQDRFTIVYVTSSDSFSPFLENEVPFEFLMALDETMIHREIIDWSLYLPEKWELILTKWNPRKVISVGVSPDRYFNQIGRV